MSNFLFCAECSNTCLKFETEMELEAHIASDHMNFCIYECEKCRFAKFPTEYALISHYKNDHGLTDFVIKYRFSLDIEQKKAELRHRLQESLQLRHFAEQMLNVPVKAEDQSQSSQFTTIPPVPSPLSSNQQSPPISTSPVLSLRDLLQPTTSYKRHIEKSGDQTAKKRTTECSLCGEIVSAQRASMVYHANTRHGKYEIYKCTICQKSWNTIAKSDVLKHLKTHVTYPLEKIDVSVIIDNRKALSEKLKEVAVQCFPDNYKFRQLTQFAGMITENFPDRDIDDFTIEDDVVD